MSKRAEQLRLAIVAFDNGRLNEAANALEKSDSPIDHENAVNCRNLAVGGAPHMIQTLGSLLRKHLEMAEMFNDMTQAANPDHVNVLKAYSERLKAQCLEEGITLTNVDQVIAKLLMTSAHDKTWELWREKNPGPLILGGADLSGLLIRDVIFREADFAGSKCDNTFFVSCHFQKANLARASFRRAHILNFMPAGQHDAANCQDCDFSGAYLLKSYFAGVNFRGADFSGATINGAGVDEKTDFTDARFSGCILKWDKGEWTTKFIARLTLEQKNAVLVEGKNAVSLAGKSDCFIATACYGDAEAPQVRAFRSFRDGTLLKLSCGRWLADQYYSYSPRFADYLHQHPRIAVMVRRLILDPILVLIKRT